MPAPVVLRRQGTYRLMKELAGEAGEKMLDVLGGYRRRTYNNNISNRIM